MVRENQNRIASTSRPGDRVRAADKLARAEHLGLEPKRLVAKRAKRGKEERGD